MESVFCAILSEFVSSGFATKSLLAGAIGSALCAISCFASPAPPTTDEIVEKAVARAEAAQEASAQRDYTYTKVTVLEELDSTGKVKERKEKVYQVLFQGGSTHLKLVQVDGHDPSQGDLKKMADNDATVQKVLADSKNKAAPRDNFLTRDLVARFDFKLVGLDSVNGRDAYQVAFEPKNPELPVQHFVDRLLNRLSGTLWIDAQEFEVARADVSLKSEVKLLGGLVASLKKAAYTMTRTRVAEGVWVNTASHGDFQGRKLMDDMRIKLKSHASNFKGLG